MEFTALTTTILGSRGEEFLTEFAQAHDSKAYIPSISESYPVDGIAISAKGKAWGIEVKTKPRMKYYEQTGFDSNDFLAYCNLGFPVYILFVDYVTKSIYGAFVSHLKRFSLPKGKLVLFPLSCMTKYRDLTDDEVLYIKELNGSNYWN